MNTITLHSLFLVGGYLVGSFPTGVVLSRAKYRIDIREMGSGNIGATNVSRVFGWWAGILTLALDFLKGFLPLLLVAYYFPQEQYPWLMAFTGVSLVFGHCFSAFLGCSGGKGVATSLGCLGVVAPPAALLSVTAYVVLLLLTKISAVGSLGGLLVALIYLVVSGTGASTLSFIMVLSAIVIYRHKGNIERLWVTVRNKQKKEESQ